MSAGFRGQVAFVGNAKGPELLVQPIIPAVPVLISRVAAEE
jgi:hypothetical protein